MFPTNDEPLKRVLGGGIGGVYKWGGTIRRTTIANVLPVPMRSLQEVVTSYFGMV